MLGLERKLEPGIQRELVLVLGIQAELSFRCTSSQVLRAGGALQMANPAPTPVS